MFFEMVNNYVSIAKYLAMTEDSRLDYLLDSLLFFLHNEYLIVDMDKINLKQDVLLLTYYIKR